MIDSHSPNLRASTAYLDLPGSSYCSMIPKGTSCTSIQSNNCSYAPNVSTVVEGKKRHTSWQLFNPRIVTGVVTCLMVSDFMQKISVKVSCFELIASPSKRLFLFCLWQTRWINLVCCFGMTGTFCLCNWLCKGLITRGKEPVCGISMWTLLLWVNSFAALTLSLSVNSICQRYNMFTKFSLWKLAVFVKKTADKNKKFIKINYFNIL